jgi:Flp pilus assembly protein TadG
VLVMFILSLTALLGMLGLVADGGVMMATHRRAQNAADSAAMAAALDLMRGQTVQTATATATTFVQTYNGLSGAGVAVHIPPTAGPHAGDANYAEVVVAYTCSTVFAGLVGADATPQVQARAVAGYEPLTTGEGAIVLDPTAPTGLTFNGNNTRLKVKGSVVVNSRSNGWDQYGQPVPVGTTPSSPYAITTSNSQVADPTQAYVQARAVQVVGGVDTPGNIRDYDDPVNGPSPLYTGSTVGPDPLRSLPVPGPSTVSSITGSGWTTRISAVKVSSNQTVTLNPGIYEDINITGGDVTFNPGVYILSPTKNNQGLRISGTDAAPRGVRGTDVMFYFAASNYLTGGAGSLDAADGAFDGPLPPTNGSTSLPQDANGVNLATLAIAGSGGNVSLTGLAYQTGDPNDRVLFFGRRRSQDPSGSKGLYSISGGGSGNMAVSVQGTIYAKWAQFGLSGGGTYNAQFIVGSLKLGGGATMTINGTGINRGRANQVFLVE